MDSATLNSGSLLVVLGSFFAILSTIGALVQLREYIRHWAIFWGGVISLLALSIAEYESSQPNSVNHSLANNWADASVIVSALFLIFAAFLSIRAARENTSTINSGWLALFILILTSLSSYLAVFIFYGGLAFFLPCLLTFAFSFIGPKATTNRTNESEESQ